MPLCRLANDIYEGLLGLACNRLHPPYSRSSGVDRSLIASENVALLFVLNVDLQGTKMSRVTGGALCRPVHELGSTKI